MRENKLADLSMLFAVNALELANLVEEQKVKNLLHDCGELRRILVASITTLKNK